MTRKQKQTLLRIGVSLAGFLAAALLPVTGWARLAAFLVPYGIVGWDVLWRAVRNIAHGQVFDENFLMALATVGAFFVGEYPEGVFVMLFYQVGEFFQDYAVGRSRASIASLMDIRPDYANIEREGGLEQVDPEDVSVGDIIVIKAGERVPLDGVVEEGTSSLDTAALTGEPLPRQIAPGADIISGCVNLTGLLRVRVTRPFETSTVAKILDLVENASSKKARAENFITKFARYYTPAVVLAAVALAVIPPLVLHWSWAEGISRALNFLVVSCPCALVISVPLAFFGGIGGASKAGILVKGGSYLEALAKAETIVFDKTGTLTQGGFCVTETVAAEGSQARLLELAALAESYSDHPIAHSLRVAGGANLDTGRVAQVEELAGRGIRAEVDGIPVYVGNGKLMDEMGIAYPACQAVGTAVHVAAQGRYQGYLVVADAVKEDAAAAITALKAAGVQKTVMLTGDAWETGEAVARRLGLDEVHAELLPAGKVEEVERLLEETAGTLVFVGDGINDAPVLSRADVGIAMGGLGSDAAIEAADIVLMDDKPSKIATAIQIARRTLTIVRQNIVFALGVKALVLILSALGMANMWAAVFADVGVSVLAILNAMRALQTKTASKGSAPPLPDIVAE